MDPNIYIYIFNSQHFYHDMRNMRNNCKELFMKNQKFRNFAYRVRSKYKRFKR